MYAISVDLVPWQTQSTWCKLYVVQLLFLDGSTSGPSAGNEDSEMLCMCDCGELVCCYAKVATKVGITFISETLVR